MKEELINWFCNKGLNKEDIIEKTSENYLELGYVDSLGFLELVSFCEETFGVSFDYTTSDNTSGGFDDLDYDDTDFEDEDFENDAIFTIDGLLEVITKKAK